MPKPCLHPRSQPLNVSAPWFRTGDVLFVPRTRGGGELRVPIRLGEVEDLLAGAVYPTHDEYAASLDDPDGRDSGHATSSLRPAVFLNREHVSVRLRQFRCSKDTLLSCTRAAGLFCQLPVEDQCTPWGRPAKPSTMRQMLSNMERGIFKLRHPGYIAGLCTVYRRSLGDLVVTDETLFEHMLTSHATSKTLPGVSDYSRVPVALRNLVINNAVMYVQDRLRRISDTRRRQAAPQARQGRLYTEKEVDDLVHERIQTMLKNGDIVRPGLETPKALDQPEQPSAQPPTAPQVFDSTLVSPTLDINIDDIDLESPNAIARLVEETRG